MRIRNISVIIVFLFCIIILRLWQLQIIKGNYYQKLSENNRIRLISIPAARGRLLDRNGQVLAESRPSFEVGLIETEMNKKQRQEVLKTLSRLLKVSYSELEEKLFRDDSPPFVPKIVLRDITRQQAISIEIQRWNLPGVIIQAVPLRQYPFGQIACHVLGYLGLINREELTCLRPYGFQPKDVIGRAGVEKLFDEQLRGQPGGRQLEVDRRGQVVNLLNQRNPIRGQDVQLSIDIRLQKEAEALLGDRAGVIVVMDNRDGQILALASHPGYNPAVFVDAGFTRERNKLIDDNKNKPLVNRAISGEYVPGSIFKIAVAAGSLEKRKINEHTTISCPGYKKIGRRDFKCWKDGGHGEVDIFRAIAGSCNVFFYTAALRLGPDELARYAHMLGLGQLTNVELTNERKGLIPDRRWKKVTLNQGWHDGETANYAIGQGYVALTPMQALVMVSVIASNGYLIKPTLIKESITRKEKVNISEVTLRIIKQGLYDVVQKEYGTAFFCRINELPFSGKTGSAQASRDRTHGWFVGYAPSKDPEISFVVFLEETVGGGHEAAQLARGLVKFWKEMK